MDARIIARVSSLLGKFGITRSRGTALVPSPPLLIHCPVFTRSEAAERLYTPARGAVLVPPRSLCIRLLMPSTIADRPPSTKWCRGGRTSGSSRSGGHVRHEGYYVPTACTALRLDLALCSADAVETSDTRSTRPNVSARTCLATPHRFARASASCDSCAACRPPPHVRMIKSSLWPIIDRNAGSALQPQLPLRAVLPSANAYADERVASHARTEARVDTDVPRVPRITQHAAATQPSRWPNGLVGAPLQKDRTRRSGWDTYLHGRISLSTYGVRVYRRHPRVSVEN